MTAGRGPRADRWRRLARRAGPRTLRTRVTAAAGLALTTAVMLGLVAMYRLQVGSAES